MTALRGFAVCLVMTIGFFNPPVGCGVALGYGLAIFLLVTRPK